MAMPKRRVVGLVLVAVLLGVGVAAAMAWASSNYPAATGTMMGAGCSGGCGGGGAEGACPMMRGAGKGAATGTGSCPMMKMGAKPGGAGYVNVNPKSAALWDKQGKLLDEHRAALWQLFTVESQQPVDKTKLAAAQKSLAAVDTQMGAVRTQLAEYWKATPGATALAPQKSMACGGNCAMGGACGAK